MYDIRAALSKRRQNVSFHISSTQKYDNCNKFGYQMMNTWDSSNTIQVHVHSI